ncbi:hypothetical protein L249_4669 [Ophiocordyceps polyrhachis-furcata BCC 54312]|uniref:Major facilitator superfamily (MFS) profile domain-containing protein n=1 Tax=Ophiocordyceps polyrhachis-furcata BCC 54312 TaxID=1330021 RepID=A0A367L2K3_9HYPO|nr:hypothetical protein L249_4669 [Ophiocordyceps polyrhachis-furcata BCC 54312]
MEQHDYFKMNSPIVEVSEKDEKGTNLSSSSSAHASENGEAEGQPLAPTLTGPPYSVFTTWQKRALALGAAGAGFFSPLTAMVFLPALTAIARDLNVTIAEINLTITTYMVFQGITPTLIGSLADSGGRRPAYILCFVIYIAANIGLAMAPNYGALMALRCLQSAGSSSTIALCTAVVADVVTSAERGQYVGFTLVPAVLAPALGPVIGGLLSQFLGWRSIFWFLAISAGATLILIICFFPETCRHIVGDGSFLPPPLYRNVWQALRKRRRRTDEKRGTSKKSQFKFQVPNIMTSLYMLVRKETAVLLWTSSLVFAGFYCVASALPVLFAERYGFDEIKVGLMYLPMAAGSIGAACIVGPLINWNFQRHCKKLGVVCDGKRQQDLSAFPIERARLEIGLPLLAVAGASIIGWGWAIQARAHVAVPCVINVGLGIGIIGFNNTSNVLLVDMHPGKAGTATAANNLTRCLVGAGASAAIVPMIGAMTVGWAFTLVGGLLFLCWPPILLIAPTRSRSQAMSTLSIWTSLFCLSARALAWLALGASTVAIYRLWLHPLGRVPGPRLAAVTNLWYALKIRNGCAVELATTLHRKYGEAVRVGPNEVWFNSREAYDQIYGARGGYEKSDFYLATCLTRPRLDWRLRLHFPDTLDLLSERDTKRYRLQRRLIGQVYRASNVAKFEAAIDRVLDQAVEAVGRVEGAALDLNEWMHIVVVECLCACVLSWSPGMLRERTDHGSLIHSYQGWRRKSVFGLFPLAAKLALLRPEIDRLLGRLWGVTWEKPPGFRTFFPEVSKRISRRLRTALRPVPTADNRADLLADLIQLHRDKPEFNDKYLKKMAMTNFGAGHETMASTLTSILAMIGSHPEVHKRAASEIRVEPDVSRLQYTRATIKEAMRLHPVVAMSLPRKAPPGGLGIRGLWLPPDTTVGCSPVALHRNEQIFGPDAASFKPDRWLRAETESRWMMDRCSLSWGGGSRSCPGRQLAELVVLKVVTRLLADFDVKVEMTR